MLVINFYAVEKSHSVRQFPSLHIQDRRAVRLFCILLAISAAQVEQQVSVCMCPCVFLSEHYLSNKMTFKAYLIFGMLAQLRF